MNKVILETRNLKKVHALGKGEEVQALRGVNLRVEEGEFASIIGASGSGKSTLLHILGFMDKPTSGELFFEGRLMGSMKDAEMTRIRRTEIGFIFQTFNLIPSLSALENVLFPARFVKGVSLKDQQDRARELLEMVGLGDRINHRPSELSGGQRQRVAIARSLINRPRILLADEPTGNLDSVTGARVVELMQRLNSEGQTIVLVTHNPEIAAMTKTIHRMKDGLLTTVTAEEFSAVG